MKNATSQAINENVSSSKKALLEQLVKKNVPDAGIDCRYPITCKIG